MDAVAVRNLLVGILMGNGDTGSRMASSYPGAKPAYPSPLGTYVFMCESLVKDNGVYDRAGAEAIADKTIKHLNAKGFFG